MKEIIIKIAKTVNLLRMFPNLPTDNLYKFSFVGCLFLIGLEVYFYVTIQKSLTESYDKYKIESLVMDAEFSKLKFEYLKLEEMLDRNRLDNDSSNHLIDIFSESKEKFKTNELILNKKIENIETHIVQFDKSKPYMLLSFIVLLFGTIFFACKWYYRLQKHQDTIIEREANKP